MTPEGGGVDGRRLTVRFQATATKVLFDDAKRAYGVRYLEDGETREAHAAKKVVVCAGLRSAQLLMLRSCSCCRASVRPRCSSVRACRRSASTSMWGATSWTTRTRVPCSA
ncbi:GMC family oxidoreductase N-terminal domain-containing protein [Eggerthella sinensis]|uniref:GMC family oxidoreductase N-terminal domain-containing protein n=1 Tax=Eggerthella sinensis TaxID=242230 RepID=UPI003A4D92FD